MSVYKVHFLPNEPERPWAIVDEVGQVHKAAILYLDVPSATVWAPTKKDHPRGWLEVHGTLSFGSSYTARIL